MGSTTERKPIIGTIAGTSGATQQPVGLAHRAGITGGMAGGAGGGCNTRRRDRCAGRREWRGDRSPPRSACSKLPLDSKLPERGEVDALAELCDGAGARAPNSCAETTFLISAANRCSLIARAALSIDGEATTKASSFTTPAALNSFRRRRGRGQIDRMRHDAAGRDGDRRHAHRQTGAESLDLHRARGHAGEAVVAIGIGKHLERRADRR